jgi:hypothetical protein
MFSAREVALELGDGANETATAIARVLATLPQVEAKTVGAGFLPDGLWSFI